MLRKHDWTYELDIAGAFTRYRCWSCQASKYEHPTGRVTYSTATFPPESGQEPIVHEYLTEEPCCSPAFDPAIPIEDLAKAGFVPIAMVSAPVPAELTHVTTVRRIAARLRAEGYESAADRILVDEGSLAFKLATPWLEDE